MRLFSFILAASSAAVLTHAKPQPGSVGRRDVHVRAATTSSAAAASGTGEPCAQISSAVIQGDTFLNADVALACLNSVPVQKSSDLLQLQGLQTMLDFQSTLVYLKNPPPGFLYPGVDLQGSLSDIITNVKNGKYSSEYAVQIDVFNLLGSAHDFHLIIRPDILSVFSWGRSESLISIATDPLSLPDIYALSDFAAILTAGNSSYGYKPSPVVSIEGKDVEEWINEYATINPWDHDPDANYNGVLYSVPGNVSGLQNGNYFAANFYNFAGGSTALKFANGTTLSVQSFATSNQQDWSGVTNGATFFQKFCNQGLAAASSSAAGPSATLSLPASSSSVAASVTSSAIPLISTENVYTPVPTASSVPGPEFYPEAIVAASDLSISGYFPDDPSDLAVIVVPTFEPASDYEFQDVFRSFLATAKANQRTRLMIDLRGNGGGHVADGYDMFKQLFPSADPWGSTNIAAFPLFNDMGMVASDAVGQGVYTDEQLEPLSELDYRSSLTPAGTSFTSWEALYGPVEHYGGNFTNLKRYNLSNPYAVGSPMYGYVNDTRPQPQTYSSDNIVILSDAFCGSTCAVFAEFMKTQAQVPAIAVGGRKQYGPMQWVGGSKGANDQSMVDIGQVIEQAAAAQPSLFAPYIQAGLKPALLALFNRMANPSNDANVNFQNNIRKGDSSATPLMFVYEAASCRFFYTAQMIAQQELVWKQAYDIQWNKGACVKGSDNQPSAALGFDTSYFNSAPPASANNSFGAPESFSYPGAYTQGEHPTASAGSSATGTGSSPAATTSKKSGSGRNLVSTASLLGAVVLGLWLL